MDSGSNSTHHLRGGCILAYVDKNVKYRNGIYLNDMVKYNGVTCWVYGFSGGERSKSAVLKDIDGNMVRNPNLAGLVVDMRLFEFICHNNNWQYDFIRCS